MTKPGEIAAVVVLYHPDPMEVKRNINSYLSFVSKLYIVDNTPAASIASQDILTDEKKISYIASGKNEGIAAALNTGASLAAEAGYHWLLTMDQDSFFEADQAEKYFSAFRQNFVNNGSVAVVAPSHFIDKVNAATEYVQEMAVITSGSLINLAVWKEIGGYDNKLFIDEVDHEYCYRAKTKGYSVFRFPSIHLNHKLGEKKEAGYSGSIAKRKRTIHSPRRVYFMVRNYLYVRKKYKSAFPAEFKTRDKMLRTAIKNNVLFSGSFFQNISSVIKGYRDFKNNKFDSTI